MIYAVVLAAGASSRYGTVPPKQQELLPPVLAALRRSAVDGLVVVTGAHEIETDAPTVRCADWELGPGASLRCGLASLPAGAEAAVVVLADGPALDPRAVDRVVDAQPTPRRGVVQVARRDVAVSDAAADQPPRERFWRREQHRTRRETAT